METTAIVHNQEALTYFKTFEFLCHDGAARLSVAHTGGTAKLHIARCKLLQPIIFEDVLDLMIKQSPDVHCFVLHSHGFDDGFEMPLTKGNQSAEARRFAVKRLMQIDEVRSDMARADKVPGNWQAILSKAGIVTSEPPGGQNIDSVIRPAVQAWIDAHIASLTLTTQDADRLIDKMHQVQNRRIDIIEFRGCLLGKDVATMWLFLKFFGTDILGAPDVLSGFGETPINFGMDSKSGKLWIDRLANLGVGSVRQYDTSDGLSTGNRFALGTRVDSSGLNADVKAAGTSRAAIKEWVSLYLGHENAAAHASAQLPLHWLESMPPSVPSELDRIYWQHIRYLTVTDEGPGIPTGLFD